MHFHRSTNCMTKSIMTTNGIELEKVQDCCLPAVAGYIKNNIDES